MMQATRLEQSGLLFYRIAPGVIRLVTSWQTTDADIDQTLSRWSTACHRDEAATDATLATMTQADCSLDQRRRRSGNERSDSRGHDAAAWRWVTNRWACDTATGGWSRRTQDARCLEGRRRTTSAAARSCSRHDRVPSSTPAEVRRRTGHARPSDAGIEGLIVIGGNGSLTGAMALTDPAEAGDWPVRVVGIPASIDNDIALTSLSIGVDTAMNTIVEACDRIADTASAHNRVFIVEVMGRDCGYLAMASAVAAGADMVLFPEADRSEAELVSAVVDAVLAVRARDGAQKVIAIKAEGIDTPTERLKDLVDSQLARRSDIPPDRDRDPRHGARSRGPRWTPERIRPTVGQPDGQRGRAHHRGGPDTGRWSPGNLRSMRQAAWANVRHSIPIVT